MTYRISDINREAASSRLPYWAKSNNPIVRRHLGLYWRTIPPEFSTLAKILGIWFVVILLAQSLPILFNFSTIIIVVSIIGIPVAMVIYGRILLDIVARTAQTMSQELSNKTMPLLRTTPMSLEQIFLGKVAAALWKQMDNLVIVVYMVAIFGMPLIVRHYGTMLPNDSLEEVYNLGWRLIIIGGHLVSILRIPLETMMVGVWGVMLGAFIHSKSTSIIAASVLTGFYFVLLNMLHFFFLNQHLSLVADINKVGGTRVSQPEYIELSQQLGQTAIPVFISDIILPIALPLIIIWLSMKVTKRVILADE